MRTTRRSGPSQRARTRVNAHRSMPQHERLRLAQRRPRQRASHAEKPLGGHPRVGPIGRPPAVGTGRRAAVVAVDCITKRCFQRCSARTARNQTLQPAPACPPPPNTPGGARGHRARPRDGPHGAAHGAGRALVGGRTHPGAQKHKYNRQKTAQNKWPSNEAASPNSCARASRPAPIDAGDPETRLPGGAGKYTSPE